MALSVRAGGLPNTGADFSVHLIPGSLQLIDIQDRLVTYRSPYRAATGILEDALIPLLREEARKDRAFTHIVIDCPPSLGLVTQNALALTDYVIVPVLLDAYSHWGLDKIVERLEHLHRCIAGCSAQIAGVLYSKVNTSATILNLKYDGDFKKWLAARAAAPGQMAFGL